MSEFEKVISKENEKNQATDENGEKKSYGDVMKERRAKCATLTAGAYLEIADSSKKYRQMLDVASNFTRNSPNNIMLIFAQKPEATQLKSFEAWKEEGKFVKKGAQAAYILVRKEYTDAKGEKRHSFDAEPRFDIADIKDAEPTPRKTYDERLLMKGLIHGCPMRVVVDANYPDDRNDGAYFDPQENIICCRYGMKIEEMFPSVAKAAAHAQMSGGDENYRVAGNEFDARSVAYILTKRYGVDASLVSIESIPDNFGDYEPDEFKGKIAEILDVAKKINGRISEVLDRPIEKKKETVKTSENEEKATPRKSKEGNER